MNILNNGMDWQDPSAPNNRYILYLDRKSVSRLSFFLYIDQTWTVGFSRLNGFTPVIFYRPLYLVVGCEHRPRVEDRTLTYNGLLL